MNCPEREKTNEAVLYTPAGLGMSFAGFTGLVVTLPIRNVTQFVHWPN